MVSWSFLLLALPKRKVLISCLALEFSFNVQCGTYSKRMFNLILVSFCCVFMYSKVLTSYNLHIDLATTNKWIPCILICLGIKIYTMMTCGIYLFVVTMLVCKLMLWGSLIHSKIVHVLNWIFSSYKYHIAYWLKVQRPNVKEKMVILYRVNFTKYSQTIVQIPHWYINFKTL